MTRSRGLTVVVPVEQFPSRIQPWLLNSLEQVVVRGGEVWVVSAQPGDPSYPPKADELGLVDRTLYVELGRVSSLVSTVAGVLAVGERGGRIRRGIRRALTSGPVFRGGPEGLANRLIKSPVFGLHGVDLIHSHAIFNAYHYLEVARSLRVPVVHTFHGLHPVGLPGLAEELREELFAEVAAVLVNTRFAQRQVESLGCPSEKVRILPQGIVLGEFPFRPSEPEPGRPLRVLTVGRLHPDKGHRFAIEAVHLLASQGVGVEYRIVGRGPYRDDLERIIEDFGVADRVTLVGSVDDDGLLQEYARSDVFLLPSVRDKTGHHEETQGVVVQEAQASGKIVVATRTGGIPECVDDGVSAFLVPDRDAPAVAETLRMIASRPERWGEWQERGREWVEEKFDIQRIGDRLWDLYGEVCSR